MCSSTFFLLRFFFSPERMFWRHSTGDIEMLKCSDYLYGKCSSSYEHMSCATFAVVKLQLALLLFCVVRLDPVYDGECSDRSRKACLPSTGPFLCGCY